MPRRSPSGVPRISTSPEVGSSSPSRISTVVVLPAPFGPSRPKHSPALDLEIEAVDGRRRPRNASRGLRHFTASAGRPGRGLPSKAASTLSRGARPSVYPRRHVDTLTSSHPRGRPSRSTTKRSRRRTCASCSPRIRSASRRCRSRRAACSSTTRSTASPKRRLKLLFALARQADVESWREKMFSGEKINGTEGRAVLHVALRNRSNRPIMVDGKDVMPEVNAVLAKMRDFTERVRSGEWKGHTGKTDHRHREHRHRRLRSRPGDGDRGAQPVLEARAARPLRLERRRHAHRRDDRSTSTPSARSSSSRRRRSRRRRRSPTRRARARGCLGKPGVDQSAVAKHFVALSTNAKEVSAFGIDTANMFEFWDWVGGRYSLWCAIGLPIAVRHRHGQLRGAARRRPRDGRALPHRAAREEPARSSSACSASGTRTSSAPQTHAILPYDQYMHRFAAYFQQGDMESNGKRVDRDGPAHHATTRRARSSGASRARTGSTRSTSSSTRARGSSRATSSRRSRRTTRSASTTRSCSRTSSRRPKR